MVVERPVAPDIYKRHAAVGQSVAPVLSGQNIICLAHEPWHGPWKTYQQIMSVLAETNRVLYVGPHISLREALMGQLSAEKRRPVLERIGQTLFVYHTPWLLARANTDRPGARTFNSVTAQLRLAQVRRLARRYRFDSPILWVYDPMMVHAVGTFGERLLVYHVLDNYEGFIDCKETALRATVSQNEERLLRRADVAVAVSDRLHQRCLRGNPNSFLVRNGVNYEMFQARTVTGEVPADMRSIPRPVIGHIGAMQWDLDFDLLQRISRERPAWSLVFVGPQELGSRSLELRALLSRPNVYYLGCKPVRDVAAYIACCDVCIMPNRPEQPTVPDSDSIKLYEYLACGRPVVSVDIPSVRRFLPLVRIATDPVDFVRCVEESLAEDPRFSELRKAAAAENSWRQRVAALSQVLVPLLSMEPSTMRRPDEFFAPQYTQP